MLLAQRKMEWHLYPDKDHCYRLDLNNHPEAIADSRALFLSRERGRPLSDKEAGLILCQHRRVLSVVFVRV